VPGSYNGFLKEKKKSSTFEFKKFVIRFHTTAFILFSCISVYGICINSFIYLINTKLLL
jgi:hypothetical protein